jgi:hypothetical protein
MEKFGYKICFEVKVKVMIIWPEKGAVRPQHLESGCPGFPEFHRLNFSVIKK